MLPLPPPITSRTNARVKALRASLSGDARRPGDLLGLEGEHLVREATLAGLSFETIYLREGNEAMCQRNDWPQGFSAAKCVVLGREVFDGVVSTASPQGIAATWRIAEPVPPQADISTALIVENIQDPGNLGTLIRSAAAFGIDEIMVTPETVNQWNPKVVRSAAGTLFRQTITRLPISESVQRLRSQGVRIFAAVSGMSTDESPASPSFGASFVESCAILIGNEGAGLSREARSLADEQVRIPCSVESLNAAVAGSVLLYEVMRQRALRPGSHEQGIRR
ncbi:MAG: TrmH family RNA methyltransferase [Janthinobacterium lividum]